VALNPYQVLSEPANAALLRVRPVLAPLQFPVDVAGVEEACQGYPGLEIDGAETRRLGDTRIAVLTGEVRFPVPDGFEAPLFAHGLALFLVQDLVTVELWNPPFEIPQKGSVLIVPINWWALETDTP